ncbi:tellurite resistance TerB family protein [Kordiimonas sp. SCSIO 12610]|uniref:tellurite resistance TerB family protein n=1 Tax=Kordiimonas sp. SCSIO 12610 TaxID=2829597 RepID=UPI00210C5719|nr:tellurite resistance TerB family protein [Kordiimonas sp. SCSIO 12610]UTW55496.1 tellurite resistance TerB family protein [Kordiimonas sp. SCSIO 12610]
MSTITPETALVYTMVVVSASDDEMTDSELTRMTGLVGYLPAFTNYNVERLRIDTASCIEILQSEEGLDAVLGLIEEAIDDTHTDLVYALACEIAASDGALSQEELRLLEMFRHYLDIDRLTAAAIERGIAARQKTFAA